MASNRAHSHRTGLVLMLLRRADVSNPALRIVGRGRAGVRRYLAGRRLLAYGGVVEVGTCTYVLVRMHVGGTACASMHQHSSVRGCLEQANTVISRKHQGWLKRIFQHCLEAWRAWSVYVRWRIGKEPFLWGQRATRTGILAAESLDFQSATQFRQAAPAHHFFSDDASPLPPSRCAPDFFIFYNSSHHNTLRVSALRHARARL